MKCPRCGGEVSQEEAFCGQCGAPNIPSAPGANHAETVSAPLPSSGLLGNPQQKPYSPLPPSYPYGVSPPPPSQPLPSAPGQQQQGGFYQEATEAMSRLPASPPAQNLPPGYAAPSFPTPGTPLQQSQYGAAPPPYNYSGPGYQQPPRPGYPSRPGSGPTALPPNLPHKQQNNTTIIVICVVLAVFLITGVAIGGSYLAHQNDNRPADQGGITPTAIITPTPTLTPTPSPTAEPSPTPTIAVTPTQVPDSGFSWCTEACSNNNFITEYPDGWQLGTIASGTPGVQFTSPTAQDVYGACKANGPTSSTASDLVNTDLQIFASRTNAATPTPTSVGPTTTISGETWASGKIYYQMDGQPKERIQVYATVHKGNAYIIELEAPDDQFDTLNTQYFVNMISRYQFQ